MTISANTAYLHAVNPMRAKPAGYPLSVAFNVSAFRNERLDFYRDGGDITPSMRASAEADVIAAYGRPSDYN